MLAGSLSSYFSVLFSCFDRFYLLCNLLSFRNALVYQTPYPVERQQNWELIYHRSITLAPLHIWKHTGYDIFTLGFRSEWLPIWLKFLHPMKCLVEQIPVGRRSQMIGKHLVLLLSQIGPQHGFGISKQLL